MTTLNPSSVHDDTVHGVSFVTQALILAKQQTFGYHSLDKLIMQRSAAFHLCCCTLTRAAWIQKIIQAYLQLAQSKRGQPLLQLNPQ